MKRILLALLVAALALFPAWALAESGAEASDDAFEDLGDIDMGDIWVVPEDGGLTWDGGSMTIALPEDASTGFAWSAELDDDTVLTAESDTVGSAGDGGMPLHTYAYLPGGDGTALVSLYYEQQDGEDVAAMLSYTATVENGKIVLNIGPFAVQGLSIENETLGFGARFGGVANHIVVPIAAVQAIYARENGRGMVFAGEEETPPPSEPEGGKKPALRVVK